MVRSKFLLLFLSILCCGGCAAPSGGGAQEAARLVDDGALLVDVRTRAEYESGHVSDAVLLPHDRILELPRILQVEKDTPLVLYCRSGRRSAIAKQKLEEAGYTNVHNAGGYEELKDALESSS